MMPHELMNRDSSLHVVALRIQETGTYNDQFLRPYTTDLDQATMNKVVNMASDAMEHGRQITALSMANVNDGRPIVTPTTAPEAKAAITNGWSERRFRFMMTVDQVDKFGNGRHRYHLSGYSTHSDQGFNGALDMEMEFFINSVMRSRVLEATTPMHGVVQNITLMNNRHVIANNNWEGGMAHNQLYMMRPEDIYTTIGMAGFTKQGTDVWNDTRIQAQRSAVTSDLHNGLSHNYASRIINTYVAASNVQQGYGENDRDVIGDAQKLSHNSVDNPLIIAISRIREYGYISNGFTLRELCKIDPNAYSVIQYFPLAQADYGMIHSAGQTSDWHGQDGVTMAAVKVCQGVPSLLGTLGLSTIAFTSTNSTLDSQFATTVSFGDSMNKFQLPQRCQGFVTRFEQEILRDITVNNQLSYYLEVRSDVYGETWIKISIGGSPMIEYVVPSFCDNLFSPIITPNNNNAQQISSDFGVLLNEIGSNYSNMPSIDLTSTHV